MAKRFPEFPTDWHQETYIANLKREVAGARLREDDEAAENALAELRRLGAADPAPKPAKAAK